MDRVKEFGTYRLCKQRRFRRACASAQSRQNLRCLLIQAVSQEEPSDRKPDPWPLWMAGHAQLKFDMTECSKTQIRLTRPKYIPQQLGIKTKTNIASTLASFNNPLVYCIVKQVRWVSDDNLGITFHKICMENKKLSFIITTLSVSLTTWLIPLVKFPLWPKNIFFNMEYSHTSAIIKATKKKENYMKRNYTSVYVL